MTSSKHLSAAVVMGLIVCVQACQRPASSHTSHPPQASPNVFDAYLDTDIPPADGFDFPIGDANEHRKLFVPRKEAKLIIVDQESYKARFHQAGVLNQEYDVSFGQGKGQKLVQGDNKTPKGVYFVIKKHRGSFDGPYGAYYGGHWIKINYPNKYDADRASAQQMITRQQQAAITSAWEKRSATLENTKLGGGIGFHGWIKKWENSGPRHLSWGCVVMHLYDIQKLYDQIPEGTMVVIL